VRGILLTSRVATVDIASSEQMRKLVDDVKQFVSTGQDRRDVDLALEIAQLAELSGDNALAADTYSSFAKLWASNRDETVSRLAAKLEGAARRMRLVGQVMNLEGTLLDGKPLRWADYRGKLVLVVFWATWCGPCRAELPEIKDVYDRYHGRGLEVVSVNLDQEREPIEAFLKENPIPWAILFEKNPQLRGFDHPMAARYGVMAIPVTMLLDKEGKGVALGLRGPKLQEELAKLLGPAEKPAQKK
jgi:thioredoxin-like negative regulator of GroEL